MTHESSAQLEELRSILTDFENSQSNDTRERVLALLPAFDSLRELGKTLVPGGRTLSARNRILKYFLQYVRVPINEKEIALIAGISEWARRVRELRVEHGWKIVTGVTTSQMIANDDIDAKLLAAELGPNDYMLVDDTQDRDSAYRWNVAKTIRNEGGGSKKRLLAYLSANVGKQVTSEELAYVAKSSEWARRIRELRTEEGWPILTQMSGSPDLPVGVYVLESSRQAPAHDRRIPDPVRRETLRRDSYKCQKCGWTHEMYNRSDPRFLELHHIEHHARGGSNATENLVTYCNVCHDEVHRMDSEA